MVSGKNFYIYLENSFQVIKEQIPKRDTPAGKKPRARLSLVMEKIGIAALTTFLVYYTVVFLHYGNLIWPDFFMRIEMGLAFLFLLSLFWAHKKISSFMAHIAGKQHPLLRSLLEVVLVVVVTISLSLLLNMLPLWLFFPDLIFVADRVRAALIISTIISLFFYYFVEREQSKKLLQEEMLRSARLQKENFEAQLQNLKNQVNPHFLFNSLNVLTSLIHINQDKAVEFVRKLSDVYRSFLDNSEKELISLKEELEVVEAYNYLLKTRFGDAIDFRTEVQPDLFSLSLPPGALQALIENAVKHNGSTKKDPLIVKIYTEDELLVVSNKLKPRKNEMQSTNTGLQNINNRYQYLSSAQPEFRKTETEFIAKLPLIKIDTDESIDH